MSNSNYSIGLQRRKPVFTAYCGLHNLAKNWSWARDVNGRDRDVDNFSRDETETRPRRDRDETLVRLETVSRPRRRDRDHNPATQARLIADTVAVVAVVAALPMITRHPATLGAKGENLQFFSHTHGVPFATNSGIKYFFTQIFSFKFPRFMYLFVLGRKSAKSRS